MLDIQDIQHSKRRFL